MAVESGERAVGIGQGVAESTDDLDLSAPQTAVAEDTALDAPLDPAPETADGPPPLDPDEALGIVESAKAYRVPADWQSLLFHYVLNNGAPKDKNIRSIARIMEAAAQFDHHLWPLELRDLVGGQDVLDFGCGSTLHGPVFRALGAKTYTGVDPAVDHARKKFRSRKTRVAEPAGFSLADVSRLMPGVSYFRGDKVTSVAAFDLVVLQSMSHRAIDIELLLQQLHRALRPQGRIWLNHMNFYSWTGHQRAPKSVKSFDPGDPAQFALADWRHVSDTPAGLEADFNRVRLTDFRRMIERLFDIEQWNVTREKKDVDARLNLDTRTRLAGFSDTELLTKSVVCVASKKAE
jgi:SAM-dependent methyltransferase